MNVAIGVKKVTADLVTNLRRYPDRNYVVGIAGCVAAGKSRFTRQVREAIQLSTKTEVVYLPFDLWINRRQLDSETYRGRFFLNELEAALDSISRGGFWLCPRHDLARYESGDDAKQISYENAEVAWRGRSYRKVRATANLRDLPGAAGVYAETDSSRLFSLFLQPSRRIYIIDGTLVFQQGMKRFYDQKIFISSKWPDRVARMIRRFNRHEAFGETTGTALEYVKFLVDEAQSCADQEVEDQADETMVRISSTVETVSNLLDLYHLQEEIQSPTLAAAYGLTSVEVSKAIDQAEQDLCSITHTETLQALRVELANLVESKHLLAVNGVEQILSDLAGKLHL